VGPSGWIKTFGCRLLSPCLKDLPGGGTCGLLSASPQAENSLKVVDPEVIIFSKSTGVVAQMHRRCLR